MEKRMEGQQWVKEIVLKVIFDFTQCFYLNFPFWNETDKGIKRDKEKGVDIMYEDKFFKVQKYKICQESNEGSDTQSIYLSLRY